MNLNFERIYSKEGLEIKGLYGNNKRRIWSRGLPGAVKGIT